MSRREIVLLVSRAVAILTIIMALINSVSLPSQVFLLSQQMRLQAAYPSTHLHMPPFQWIGFIVSLTRIVALLLIAGFFWRGGPVIERLLLPTGTEEKSDTPQ
jgi:hypothetical protein